MVVVVAVVVVVVVAEAVGGSRGLEILDRRKKNREFSNCKTLIPKAHLPVPRLRQFSSGTFSRDGWGPCRYAAFSCPGVHSFRSFRRAADWVLVKEFTLSSHYRDLCK